MQALPSTFIYALIVRKMNMFTPYTVISVPCGNQIPHLTSCLRSLLAARETDDNSTRKATIASSLPPSREVLKNLRYDQRIIEVVHLGADISWTESSHGLDLIGPWAAWFQHHGL